jgi:hypothetical protein
MPRHLTTEQIDFALRQGKSVEQLLERPAPDQLAWLELRPKSDAIELWRYEVFDDGCEEFVDLYSFSPVEGDWPMTPLGTYPDAATAASAAEAHYGVNSARWVNQFMIQDEYRDDLIRRHPAKGESP